MLRPFTLIVFLSFILTVFCKEVSAADNEWLNTTKDIADLSNVDFSVIIGLYNRKL